MLPEPKSVKKVLAWSGDFGLNQYVSWNIPSEELTLEVIWKTFEEFCKSQANKVRARFDLLTSFRQGEHSVGEKYNDVQMQVVLAKYPQEKPRSCKEIYSSFSWMMNPLFPKP